MAKKARDVHKYSDMTDVLGTRHRKWQVIEGEQLFYVDRFDYMDAKLGVKESVFNYRTNRQLKQGSKRFAELMAACLDGEPAEAPAASMPVSPELLAEAADALDAALVENRDVAPHPARGAYRRLLEVLTLQQRAWLRDVFQPAEDAARDGDVAAARDALIVAVVAALDDEVKHLDAGAAATKDARRQWVARADAAGVTRYRIAQATGRTASTVQRW